ncbi:winged helix-turn-helix domain-containing protein [Mesorhizobium sp. J428]|uniref:winged helix-turn-helix domain-containing protein n=1 Tax=Mesorhizobium sp. J428 TaxID=2898440 RepID=UPI00215072C5|nr:winged helix-turn-helix domain-containing protein [Mesorhizobium sp. J428]MCR5855430.1 winged helix-turn-helix domain-containing protein [Mesorhizobium sp. J428]
MREKLSLATARRVALAAQGFAEPRPDGSLTRRHFNKVLHRLGQFQIDSVSVAVRAHYMPLFSRLGAYPMAMLEGAATPKQRLLFEYWAHEASFLPVDAWPLWQWQMRRAERGESIYTGLAKFGRERADLIAEMERRVATDGPLAASDIEGQRGQGGWWGWSDAKAALEWLFWAGRITARERKPSFERVYDLPDRVIPQAVRDLPVPDEEEAHRQLTRMAASALGVATAGDLRDYFRLPAPNYKDRLAELVEAGHLLPVKVEGWSQPTYLSPDARFPRRVEARALLSPFDPLVWERSRAERLFDFRYRIEIYTPAEKRIYGYYVLPFLLGERIVARVDLKADRAASVLRVQAAHAEPLAPPETPAELMAELKLMAEWLGLERVGIAGAGDLAPALAAVG